MSLNQSNINVGVSGGNQNSNMSTSRVAQAFVVKQSL